MRPASFSSSVLRQHLRQHKIATLDELKSALGTRVDVTVFRKLQPLDYLTSYSHRGGYYTLQEMVDFDDQGLWFHEAVCFSRYGTLLATAEAFVNRSPKGYFAEELAQTLQIEVHDALRHLVERERISRQLVSGFYLYLSAESAMQRRQVLSRRTAQAVPLLTDASRLQLSPQELKAAILLFYSLLDEKQRRLYAALESLKLGHGGDRQLADFLGLDPHTVARGRQELLDREVEPGRVRKIGGGRKPVEKNTPISPDHRTLAGARHGRRPHHRSALDSQDPRPDCGTAAANRHPDLGQHRRPPPPRPGLLAARQS